MKFDDIAPTGAASKSTKWDDIAPTGKQATWYEDIPRQLGMFGRFGLEGIGNTADLLTAPMRLAYDPIARTTGLPTAATNIGGMAANYAGLPEPQGKLENIAGDITRTVVGTGGLMGLAKEAIPYASGVTANVLKTLTSKPDVQVASAAGAGTAGGYAKEEGAGPVVQFLAALAGGLAGPSALSAGQKVTSGIASMADRLMGSPNLNAQINLTIENALKTSGMNIADVPKSVVDQLKVDVRDAIKLGRLSPDAARRLADYRLIGATPTSANLTLDPAMVSQQRNLAKIGINSRDPALQKIGQIQNANNQTLIENMNKLGADTSDDGIAAAQKIMSAIEGKNASAKSTIDALYQQARATGGRSANLDPSAFTNRASNLLDEALIGGKLPADVRNKLNQVAMGKMPLTVDVAEQFKTAIGNLQRASSDAAERKALGMVRQALDETPLLEGQGQQAIDAFNKARSANKAWMGVVDKTPALQAIRDGVEPDKFVQTFITGNTKDTNIDALWRLSNLVKGNPEASTAVRDSITQHLKNKALSGAADEVGNFSQAGYNRAFNAIGERKLSLFFSPSEINQLKAIGRVASYEQFQPRGSAINNSNTAGAAIATVLDKMGGSAILRKIPLFSEIIGNPVKSISANIQAGRSLDVPKALLAPAEKTGNAFLYPAILAPSLMSEQ